MDQKSDLLAYPPNMIKRWKYYFRQLLNACGVNDFRQTEICMAELLVLKPSAFDIEMAIEKLVRYKSSGVEQVPAELTQAGGRAVCSQIHTLFNCMWNKDDLPQEWKRVDQCTYLYK
jgi:hypothetical protein